jgi:predicted nucleic acid-binding protein
LKHFILDASVALRWLLDDPVSPHAERVKQLLIKGARATVPLLWHLEMSNGLAVAERRSILSPANIDQALLHIEQIVSQRVDTSSAFVSTRQSLATARAFKLSAYDAVYLDLARQERLPLATLDERLRAAASQAGVELLR